jgi:N6-L-threonylcarbamoyladenine synthase
MSSRINQSFILAIDTSCDDTSAAVTSGQKVLSNVVASQVQLHKQYGGVFPTVAKQAHKENIELVIRDALQKSGITKKDLSAIAVTQGPGLAPALEIGIEHAKEWALRLGIPLIAVNHIEGHALSPLAQTKKAGQDIPTRFPILAIVVSGKHTDLIKINGIGQYERIGFTVDDAAGEALDKFGRMVDIGYPAGPTIEEFAQKGDPKKYAFPLPMTTSGNANMSFSGMKTSVRNLTEELSAQKPLTKQDIYDLCASFQYSVFRAIIYKLNKVLQSETYFGIYLGGGVACNIALRQAIRQTISPYKLKLSVPYSRRLCIDNAAMIGVVAGFKLERGEVLRTAAAIQAVERRPRWETGEVIPL